MLYPLTSEGSQMTVTLTEREQQVLQLIAQGLTNREISSHLSISESTAENHIHHIYTKLRISNRAQAVAHAYRLLITRQELTRRNRGNPS
jgi:ATP/maltotriose-dependent transcriptional regulator MalT